MRRGAARGSLCASPYAAPFPRRQACSIRRPSSATRAPCTPRSPATSSRPDDAEWDIARRAWNLAVDQRPALVAFPADAADVVADRRYARRAGLKVAPQGTGHNAGRPRRRSRTRSCVSTQRMRGVEIDAEAQTARVAGRHAVARGHRGRDPARPVPALGLLARRRRRRLHARRRPELARPQARPRRQPRHGDRARDPRRASWSARPPTSTPTCSGRCAAAAATSASSPRWSSRCSPTARSTRACCCCRTSAHAEVARTPGTRWTRDRAGGDHDLDAGSCTSRRCPSCRRSCRGRSVVVIDGAYAGDADGGRRGDRARCARSSPEIDTLGAVRAGGAEPHPHGPRGADALPPATARCWARSTRRRSTRSPRHVQPGSPLLFAELRHLGGALGRVPAGAGAAGRSRGEYLFSPPASRCRRRWPPPSGRAGRRRVCAALAPVRDRHGLPQLRRAADRPVARSTRTSDYARLQAIRAAVDPDGRMVGNHPIPAAA